MGSCGSALRKSSSVKFDTPYDPSKTDRPSIPSTPVKDKPVTDYVEAASVAAAAAAPINGSSLSHKSQVSPFNSVSSFSRFGSKEETFFDAQTYMDSDCDEDFYSVYGGTPSCGNTPVHRSAAGTPSHPTLSPQVMNRAHLEGRRLSFNGPCPISHEGTPTNGGISAAPGKKNATDLNVQTTFSSQTTTSSSSPSSSSTGRKKLAELFRECGVGDNQDDQAKGRVFSLSKSANASPFTAGRNLLVRSFERTPDVVSKGGKKMPSKSAHCCLPRVVSSRSFRKRMTPPPLPAIALNA